jgi:hypothetical protein
VLRLSALAALAALALTSGAPALAQVSDRTYPVNGATDLRLNVSGNVHVIPSAGAREVVFHVVDYGPPIPKMNFVDSRSSKRLTISVSGPSQQIYPFNGASGYEIQITYPANVRLDLREFAGHVQADGLVSASQLYDADGSITVAGARGPLTAEADSGAIAVSGALSTVQLTTGNGPVTAQLAQGWRGSLVRIESSNGPLNLTVPPDFRGNYDLSSASGSVHNWLKSVKGATTVFMLTQNGSVSVTTNTATSAP